MTHGRSGSPEMDLGTPLFQEFINPDPDNIRIEAGEALGDLFTYNEVNVFIDGEVARIASERDEKIQFIFSAATRVLAEKRAQVGDIDAEIANLKDRIGELETARAMLFGEQSQPSDSLNTEEQQQSSYDKLVRSGKTAEEIAENLLAEQPFELVGGYDSRGRINLRDWLDKNRSIIGANYGKKGLSLFTRAVRTLSFTEVERLVEDGAVLVDDQDAATRFVIEDPNQFFGKMLDHKIKSFGPRSGLVLLKIAEMQAKEAKESPTSQ